MEKRRKKKDQNVVDTPQVSADANLTPKGFNGEVNATLSHTHLESSESFSIDANVISAHAELGISPSRFGGSAGLYVAETDFTARIPSGPSVSVGGNLGLGACFEYNGTTLKVGITLGFGFEVTIDWGIFCAGSTTGNTIFERKDN